MYIKWHTHSKILRIKSFIKYKLLIHCVKPLAGKDDIANYYNK
jgi:hypothetical protein